MENVSVQENGDIQFEWFRIHGLLKSVSLHRGIAWGVNRNNQLFAHTVTALRNGGHWTQIDNDFGISQVEIGEFGVFGTNDDYEIYYRVGTHNNPGSAGTRWQLLNGGLSHITSGLHNVYGVSSDNLAWQMNPNSFNEQTGEFDVDSFLWSRFGDRTGNNISAL